jgi:1,4-alpha-glucan branching enzyme
MEKGYLALILHAHLPFIRHPEHASFLEEDWLFEAITECYIPLISVLNRIVEDKVACRLTLSISPPLTEMLSDALLQARYQRYLHKRIELSEKEAQRTKNSPHFSLLAKMYLEHFTNASKLFQDSYRGNLLSAFRDLQDQRVLEITTCCATHAFMPFISREEVRRAQVSVSQGSYEKHFGQRARGFWLAECGYEPKLEYLLKEFGLEYFILDSHGLLFGNPRPRYGVFAPVVTPSGVLAFARDLESGWQVWNARGGYPGDFYYREFYRDLGYDADYDYIKPYLHKDGIRRNIGIKYYRITGGGDLGQRAPYDRQQALARVSEHATDFVRNRRRQIEGLYESFRRKAIVICPYDAELFGHWWFEGPQFLETVIRRAASEQSVFRLSTPSDFLETNHPHPAQQPAASSWGTEGYNRVWLNQDNQWLYRHQHRAEDRMVELANRFPEAHGLLKRMLNQAGRELLLAQSSDWAFMISRQASASYAVKRFRNHVSRFTTLYEKILRQDFDRDWLQPVEEQDNIFNELDYRVFRSDGGPAVRRDAVAGDVTRKSDA